MADRKLWFVRFAQKVSHVTGRPIAFLLAVATIFIWGALGPLFGYSDTWQLVINTGTTIITFLMVFVIQNTQNRDTVAMQIKLDELIRVTRKARNKLLDLEELDDKTLGGVAADYERLASKAKSRAKAPERIGPCRKDRRGHAQRRSPSVGKTEARPAIGKGKPSLPKRFYQRRRCQGRGRGVRAAARRQARAHAGQGAAGAADARPCRGGGRGVAGARGAHRSRHHAADQARQQRHRRRGRAASRR